MKRTKTRDSQMNTTLIEEMHSVQSHFVGIFNAEEKTLLEEIRKFATSEELTAIDDLLTCDFEIENNGYTYCFIDELILDVHREQYDESLGFTGLNCAFKKFLASGHAATSNKNVTPMTDAEICNLLGIEEPADKEAPPAHHVLYAVKRLIDSVWTCAYVVTGDHKVTVISYGRNINAGYKYEGSLPALETTEDENRVLTYVYIAGIPYEVENKANIFSYNVDLVLASEIEMAAKSIIGGSNEL